MTERRSQTQARVAPAAAASSPLVALLPCPFCGDPQPVFRSAGDDRYFVMCGNCGADLDSLNADGDVREAWNCRASHEATQVEPVNRSPELLAMDHAIFWAEDVTVNELAVYDKAFDDAQAIIDKLTRESESLRATLTASCTQEREQLWEATEGGGCSRAIDAEAEVAKLTRERDDAIQWRDFWRDAAGTQAIAHVEKQAELDALKADYENRLKKLCGHGMGSCDQIDELRQKLLSRS